jgi:hypothetical protein
MFVRLMALGHGICNVTDIYRGCGMECKLCVDRRVIDQSERLDLQYLPPISNSKMEKNGGPTSLTLFILLCCMSLINASGGELLHALDIISSREKSSQSIRMR